MHLRLVVFVDRISDPIEDAVHFATYAEILPGFPNGIVENIQTLTLGWQFVRLLLVNYLFLTGAKRFFLFSQNGVDFEKIISLYGAQAPHSAD